MDSFSLVAGLFLFSACSGLRLYSGTGQMIGMSSCLLGLAIVSSCHGISETPGKMRRALEGKLEENRLSKAF